VEVPPTGGDDEADEADGDCEPADDLAGAATERRQSAHEQGEPADGPNRLTDLCKPDASVRLERECECEHGAMIAAAADGAVLIAFRPSCVEKMGLPVGEGILSIPEIAWELFLGIYCTTRLPPPRMPDRRRGHATHDAGPDAALARSRRAHLTVA
jgi:hypothetical protein